MAIQQNKHKWFNQPLMTPEAVKKYRDFLIETGILMPGSGVYKPRKEQTIVADNGDKNEKLVRKYLA